MRVLDLGFCFVCLNYAHFFHEPLLRTFILVPGCSVWTLHTQSCTNESIHHGKKILGTNNLKHKAWPYCCTHESPSRETVETTTSFNSLMAA